MSRSLRDRVPADVLAEVMMPLVFPDGRPRDLYPEAVKYKEERIMYVEARAGVAQEHLKDILDGAVASVPFDRADRLLCALNAPHLWWEEPLKSIYDSLDLSEERCKRFECPDYFTITRLREHPRRQRYCSRRCRQMDYAAKVGLCVPTPPRDLDVRCRNGHRRTPETTDVNGSCRICIRIRDKIRRDRKRLERNEA